MITFFKKHHDALLVIAGLMLVLVLLGCLAWVAYSLYGDYEEMTRASTPPPPAAVFNLEGARALNL